LAAADSTIIQESHPTTGQIMFLSFFRKLFGGKADTDPAAQLNTLVYETRTDFEKRLRKLLQEAHGTQANKVAELVTNYVFDFGEHGFDMSASNVLKKPVNAEINNLAQHQLVPPKMLCKVLIHRAIQKREFSDFDAHMTDLWALCLVPVGPFTPPDSQFPTQAHRNLAERLRKIEVSRKQVEQCKLLWRKDQEFQSAADAYLR
jgi:hypothetical protein